MSISIYTNGFTKKQSFDLLRFSAARIGLHLERYSQFLDFRLSLVSLAGGRGASKCYLFRSISCTEAGFCERPDGQVFLSDVGKEMI